MVVAVVLYWVSIHNTTHHLPPLLQAAFRVPLPVCLCFFNHVKHMRVCVSTLLA